MSPLCTLLGPCSFKDLAGPAHLVCWAEHYDPARLERILAADILDANPLHPVLVSGVCAE